MKKTDSRQFFMVCPVIDHNFVIIIKVAVDPRDDTAEWIRCSLVYASHK